MINKREIWALLNLLDDPQCSVQSAVHERLLTLGENAILPLRELSRTHGNMNSERVEDIVNEIRMTNTLKRLVELYIDAVSPVDLETGIFIIAKYGYPEIDVKAYQRRLDEMAEDVKNLSGLRAAPIDRFMKMRNYLFNDLAFIGNRQDYYNPDNSYFNKVLDFRKGIPLSLSVLMLLIARRLRIALDGIGMPMHFLIQYNDGTRMFFVDAFSSGMIITQDQCKSLLSSSGFQFSPRMLTKVSDNEIVERMWRNLFLAYQQNNNEDEVKRLTEIISFINPEFKVNSTKSDDEDDDEEDL